MLALSLFQEMCFGGRNVEICIYLKFYFYYYLLLLKDLIFIDLYGILSCVLSATSLTKRPGLHNNSMLVNGELHPVATP